MTPTERIASIEARLTALKSGQAPVARKTEDLTVLLTARKSVKVSSIEEARSMVERHIRNDAEMKFIGGKTFYRFREAGHVVDSSGKTVAVVNYDGTVK